MGKKNKYPQKKYCPNCRRILYYNNILGEYLCPANCRVGNTELKPIKKK